MNSNFIEILASAEKKFKEEKNRLEKDYDCAIEDEICAEIYCTSLAELIIDKCFRAAMIESRGHMNPIFLMERMKKEVGIYNESINSPFIINKKPS